MCACEPGWTCARCADAPMERYLREGDEPDREQQAHEDAARQWMLQNALLVGTWRVW